MKRVNKLKLAKLLANDTGASLVFVLLSSFLLISLATIVIQFSNTDLKGALKQERKSTSYYIAEAGVERAIYEINRSLVTELTVLDHYSDPEFQNGSYDVWVEVATNEKNDEIGYQIQSTGSYQGEQTILTASVREPIWPEEGEQPSGLQYAIFANKDISIQTMSGLLGIGGLLNTHTIRVNDNVHGNKNIRLKHNAILFSPPAPTVNGIVSSTNKSYIHIDGLSSAKKLETDTIPMPRFDFDYAREKAKQAGKYIPHSVPNLSLLGLSPSDQVIFIDGDLTIVGLDLLGIALQERTIVVNGTITGLVEVGGGDILSTPLNLIAKEDINFLGAITGLQVNGLLFAQGEITSAGHVEVNGYLAGENISLGSGLLSSVLGLLTGRMSFEYNPNVFSTLPSNIGFKQSYVEVVEQKESSS